MARSDGSQRGELTYFRQRMEAYDLTATEREEFSELLGTLVKNGFHQDEFGTDLPKLSGRGAPAASPAFPSTLQAIRTGGWSQGIHRLEKAVGLSLASGYVGSGRCRLLLQRLSELGQAFDMLHQELQYIPGDKLRLIDGAEVS